MVKHIAIFPVLVIGKFKLHRLVEAEKTIPASQQRSCAASVLCKCQKQMHRLQAAAIAVCVFLRCLNQPFPLFAHTALHDHFSVRDLLAVFAKGHKNKPLLPAGVYDGYFRYA
ncbi:MAG: hypothetical protein IJP01_04010 [Oscillospiraceae bacterium]|nr:hypothetical protein [Oscillospiraceae bacterium]